MFIREGGTTMFVEFKRPDGRGTTQMTKEHGRSFSDIAISLLITLRTSRKD